MYHEVETVRNSMGQITQFFSQVSCKEKCYTGCREAKWAYKK